MHQVSGNDRNNPHAHIVIHDRDPDTGKTVAQLSNQHSTEYLRRLWAETVNAALESAGQQIRVDHRSYQKQGITKQPNSGIEAQDSNKSKRNWSQ
ncbi:MAG: MobA/MobL family protein [Candidatus Competibacteraceae bacterium]|nr:MobA/MobL family protein [Candidatus Competibacteraceae bacterium]